MEGMEATDFRTRAIELMGEASYRNLLHPCRIYPSGDDLVLKATSETLARVLRDKADQGLGHIAQTLGFGLRVIVGEVHRLRAPDPKVADAVRQLEAIRGGRVAGAALQAGGRR